MLPIGLKTKEIGQLESQASELRLAELYPTLAHAIFASLYPESQAWQPYGFDLVKVEGMIAFLEGLQQLPSQPSPETLPTFLAQQKEVIGKLEQQINAAFDRIQGEVVQANLQQFIKARPQLPETTREKLSSCSTLPIEELVFLQEKIGDFLLLKILFADTLKQFGLPKVKEFFQLLDLSATQLTIEQLCHAGMNVTTAGDALSSRRRIQQALRDPVTADILARLHLTEEDLVLGIILEHYYLHSPQSEICYLLLAHPEGESSILNSLEQVATMIKSSSLLGPIQLLLLGYVEQIKQNAASANFYESRRTIESLTTWVGIGLDRLAEVSATPTVAEK